MDVGAVDGHMASVASLVARVDHAVRGMVRISDAAVRSGAEVAVAGVALQTKLGDGRPREQLGIRGTVRPMATDTAVHLPSLMFKDERTALLDVAAHARLQAIVGLVQHFRGLPHAESGCEPAVRVVTVRAVHQALIHAVLVRQVELRPHVRVALVTGVRLALGKQVFGCGRLMNGVASGAGDIVIRVLRTPDIGSTELLGMAGQASIDDLPRRHHAKSIDDGLYVAAGIHMRLTWAMTSLAAGPVRGFLAGSNTFEVRVLVKTVPNRVMLVTVPASGIPGVSPCRAGLLRQHRRCLARTRSSGLPG